MAGENWTDDGNEQRLMGKAQENNEDAKNDDDDQGEDMDDEEDEEENIRGDENAV